MGAAPDDGPFADPVRVVAEVTEWTPLTPEARQMWRERLVKLTGDDAGEIVD